MNMLKKFSLLLFVLTMGFTAFPQKDLVISGGSVVSSLVCGNNQVFVAGENKDGGLGVGSSASYVDEWTHVDFPDGITIQQVNSGSGPSFIALSCSSHGNEVWCWGNNDVGQCGQGNTNDGVVTEPKRVVAGCLANESQYYTVHDGVKYLSNIEVVYAGNANSFAILGEGKYKGRVVAWGGNMSSYEASLGTGNNNKTSEPAWCKDLDGNYMENIVQIFSGDDATVALDADGHVWTCGAINKPSSGLGRLAGGGYSGDNSNNGSSNAFGLVYVGPDEPLSNIVQIAAGDVAYFALDSEGYVWAWGDEWHGAFGQGRSSGPSLYSPKRVIKGNVNDEDSDGTYLLAKQIGAGNASGMAVSITGKPVSWGAHAGHGSDDEDVNPGYVTYTANKNNYHTDVILINKGDNWGFYERANGEMYAWGLNDNGQLGMTKSNPKPYATRINPPSGCDNFFDPRPTASIMPKSMKVCASEFDPITLNCGFVVSKADLLDLYEITWYKDGTKITSASGNATKTTCTTSAGTAGMGTYKVKVHYKGTNSGCENYEDAEDEITISAYEKTFDVADDFKFCNDKVTVNVSKINNDFNDKAVYSWFSNSNGTGLLGQSIGEEEITLDLPSNLSWSNSPTNTQKTIYVQETATGSGSLIPGTQSQRTNSSNTFNQPNNFAALGVNVAKPTTFVSTMLYVKPKIQVSSGNGTECETEEEARAQRKLCEGTITLTITICGSTMSNNYYVPNTSDRKKTITKTLSYSYEAEPAQIENKHIRWDQELQTNIYHYIPKWQDQSIDLPIELVEIPIDKELGEGLYYFTVAGSSSGALSKTENQAIYQYSGSLVGEVDGIDGSSVSIYGAATNGNYNSANSGPLFNFQLYSGQGYCDIIPVTITEDCPCNHPGEFTVVATDNKTKLCPDESTTLSINRTVAADDPAKVGYKWYKGTRELTDFAGESSILVTEAGTYTLQAYDTDAPNSQSCTFDAAIKVTSAPKPTVTVGSGKSYCANQTVNDISLTFTGTAPFDYTYTENGGTAQSGTVAGSPGKITPTKVVEDGMAFSEYEYKITSLSDANCVGEAPTTTATVTIVAVPTATITASTDEICAPSEITLTGSSDVADATLTWSGAGSGSDATQTASGAGTYTYTLTATNKVDSKSCTSAEATKTVVINPKPEIEIQVVGDDAVCSGGTISLKATSTTQNGTFTWLGDGVTGNGANATVTKTATWPNVEHVTVTLNYVSESGCSADAVTKTVTFNPVPNKPTESNTKSYCMDATANDVTLTASASTDCQLQWYEGSTKLNAAPSISIKSATTYNYKVTQLFEGCESEATDIAIEVNAKLVPELLITKNELCIGGKTAVTVADANTYTTVTWSGNASSNFDNTTVKDPQFTAPSATAKTEYTVHVYVANSVCNGENEAKITVYPTPTVSLSVNDADLCVGDVATITATVTGDDADGTSTWTGTSTSELKSATLTGANDGTTDKTVNITYAYVSSHSCPAEVKSTDVTVRAVPAAPTTSPYTKCLNADAEPLDDAKYVTKKVGTLNWYGTDGSALQTVPEGATNTVISPAVNYYVSQTVNGCESPRAALPVTINANLEPTINASDNGAVCEGNSITLSTEGGFVSERWSTVFDGFSSYLTSSSNLTTFQGAPAGLYEVKVEVVDGNGCKGTKTRELHIYPIPTVTFRPYDAEHCYSVSTPQTITAEPSADGTGTWSSNVTNTANLTAEFVPSSLEQSEDIRYITITYDFESELGCAAPQASITMTVFPMPSPRISVSNKKVCHDGTTNMDNVVVTASNVSPSGTFNYSISSATNPNAVLEEITTPGECEFDPKKDVNVAGDYMVLLTYTDPNGCGAVISDNFTVYNKPSVEISAPTEICYNAGELTLDAEVTPTGGNGTWTGTTSGSSFDPKHYPAGDNTVAYTYKDANNCSNSAEKTINVVKVDHPTITNVTPPTVIINQGTMSEGSSSTMTAEAADAEDKIQWFEGESDNGTVDLVQKGQDGDVSYEMPVDPQTAVEGSYPYTLRSFRMVDGKACYSDTVFTRVVITKCSAVAPIASDIYVCTNENNPVLTLTAERHPASKQLISDENSYIAWFKDDPIGKSNSELEDLWLTAKNENHNEFTPTIENTTVKGDHSFYVAEYDKTGTGCWSVGTKVTIHVVDTPSVTIPDILDFCAHGDDQIHIEVTPRTGTLAFDGDALGEIDGLVWTPGSYAPQAQRTGSFVYTVNSAEYADHTVCSSAPKFKVNAHYMAPTNGSTTNWLIKLANEIPALPAYTNHENENNKPSEPVTWYSDRNKTTIIGDDNDDKTYAVGDLSATVAGRSTYNVSYWVTRTDEFGCESEPAEVALVLAECPWEAPAVEPIKICSENEDGMPNLVATPGDLQMATGQQVSGWKWVNVTAGTEVENTNSSYETGLPYTVSETTVTTYKVSYKAEEKNSGAECWSPEKTVTVTVDALPKVTIDMIGTPRDNGEIGVLCHDGGDFIATATDNGVRISNGVWSVDKIASLIDEGTGIITPSLSVENGEPADGEYTAHVVYTNGDGCTSSADRKFVVEFAEKPTTTPYVGMTSSAETVVLTAENIESDENKQTATVVSWYRTESSQNEIGENANPWTVDESIINPAEATEADGTSLYVSQTVNGCVSERAEQKVTIVDCPWTVETVTNAETCEGIAFTEEMKATANDGAAPTKWSWSTSKDELNEIPGLTGTEVTFTQEDVSATGVTTYYVSYFAFYDKGNAECWSEPREVTSTVHSNPSVTFNADDPESVCYTDGDSRVRVEVVPGDNGQGVSNAIATTVWTTTGSSESFSTKTESYAYFNTLEQDQETKTYTITVAVEDEKGCQAENERNIKVVYLPKPTTKGFYAMTSQKNDVVVEVTSDLAPDATIHWFDNDAGKNPDIRRNKNDEGDGTTWKTGLPYDREVEISYFARQYDASANCYSEATEALVRLVPCPIPNVIVDAPEACVYDVASGKATMTAATADWSERDGSKSEFRFYTSADKTVTDFEIGDGNGKFDPRNAVTEPNVYSYYVSEYNALPLQGLTNPEGCESNRAKTTVTVIKTDEPVIVAINNTVCDGENDKLAFKSTYNSMGIGAIWFEEDPGETGIPTADGSATQMTFNPTGASSGEYTIYAVRFENGCYSDRASATYTIKPIPDAPELEGAEVCFEETNVPVSAVNLEEGDIINWYADEHATRLLAKNTPTYRSKETSPDEYTYYASKTVGGCESSIKAHGLASVVYTIKPLPFAPQVDYRASNCDYDDPVVIKAYDPKDETKTIPATNVRWYSTIDKTVLLNEEYTDTYTVDESVMTLGIKRFYATQTVNGCEGPTKTVMFNVYKKPESPKVTGASICQGDTLFPTLSTNLSIDVWWTDSLMENQIDKGYTHTPLESEVGNTDVTYYITRTQNGCISDTVPVTLRVIPTPTFTINNDTTLCIYDDVVEIKAENFKPEINDASMIIWYAGRTDGVMRGVADGEEHSITPSDIVNEATEYTISATYKYVSDGISCVSEPVSMQYKLIDRARKPIVFSKTICQGSEIKDLQALGSQHVVWKSLDGTLPEDFHGPKYKFQPGQILDTGTYRFEIYDLNMYSIDEEDESQSLGCISEVDTVSLIVAPGAHAKIFGRDSVCMGTIGETYFTQYSEGSLYYWAVTGDNLNYSKDAVSTSVRYIDWLTAGVDTIMVYEQTWAGCEGFDTVIVHIAPPPIAHYTWTMPGSLNVIELQDSTTQDSLWTVDVNGEPLALPIEYTMSWNLGHQGTPESYVDTVIPYNQRNFPLVEGGYLYGYNCPILTVTNDFGCKDIYTECMFVNLASSLFVPTAFSPSNPAHSVRTFQPKGINLETCEISVYDKWGNLLWFSNDVQDGVFVGYWDGRYEGKMMKSDVYIWKMEATFLDGQVWQGIDAGNGKMVKYGNVMLLR